jgi:hypothetical protein
MAKPGKLGRDKGKVRSVKPGEGASSVGGSVAGGSDMAGTSPDELPPRPAEQPESAGEDVSGVTHPTDPGIYDKG